MFQTLYVLACIFLVLWLAFWLVGAFFHALFFLLWLAFHIILPLAIVIFIIGLVKHKMAP